MQEDEVLNDEDEEEVINDDDDGDDYCDFDEDIAYEESRERELFGDF